MIKSIFLFCIMILWLNSQCQTPNTIKKIEFTSLTRGYHKKIIISMDSVVTVIGGRQDKEQSHKRKLMKKEWSNLMNSIKNISLSELPDLKSPTMKRAYDGALHSTIILLTEDGKTFTHSFDDDEPHEKLKPLMKVIKTMERRE